MTNTDDIKEIMDKLADGFVDNRQESILKSIRADMAHYLLDILLINFGLIVWQKNAEQYISELIDSFQAVFDNELQEFEKKSNSKDDEYFKLTRKVLSEYIKSKKEIMVSSIKDVRKSMEENK